MPNLVIVPHLSGPEAEPLPVGYNQAGSAMLLALAERRPYFVTSVWGGKPTADWADLGLDPVSQGYVTTFRFSSHLAALKLMVEEAGAPQAQHLMDDPVFLNCAVRNLTSKYLEQYDGFCRMLERANPSIIYLHRRVARDQRAMINLLAGTRGPECRVQLYD